MGTTRIDTGSQQGSTAQTQYTPTAEETEMNKLMLLEQQAISPSRMQATQQGYSLINQLLTGGNLPGYLQKLTGGISSEAIGTQAAELARKVNPQFQQLGISDSGTAFKQTARGIANELLYPTEQFNLGQTLNLLNLASGQAAQIQQASSSQAGQLSQTLAGLRSMTSTSTGFGTGYQQNPYSGLRLGILGTWGGA